MKITFERYPELKDYLQAFTDNLTPALNIRSIVLFGGIMLDDFSLKYSDIDVVVILEEGLIESDLRVIDEVIHNLMSAKPELTRILYVYFIPVFMLRSPDREFNPQDGLIYGNEKKKMFNKYPLSIMDNFSIREKGKVLYGEDNRKQFPTSPKDCFWKMFIESLPYIEEAVKKHPFQFSEEQNDHTTINWLLYFPRLLYSLINRDLIGKSDSAFWFQKEYNNAIGEFLVEIAKCRKENSEITNVKDLVLNSRRLILFTLEKILEIKKVNTPISNLIDFEKLKLDFEPVFREFKELI